MFDAVGVRVDQIPITPEKILRALDAKAAGKPARSGPASFPEIAWPESLFVTPPWEGGDGRASNEPGVDRLAKPTRAWKPQLRRCADDAASALSVSCGDDHCRCGAWLAENDANAMLLAGGTDILPSMKRRTHTPSMLIGLRGVAELNR